MWWLLLIYLSLSAGATAATVYCLWTVRWARKGAWLLALLNGVVALSGAVIALAFLMALADPVQAINRFRQDLPNVILVEILLLFPAIARLVELGKERVRETTAHELAKTLRKTVR